MGETGQPPCAIVESTASSSWLLRPSILPCRCASRNGIGGDLPADLDVGMASGRPRSTNLQQRERAGCRCRIAVFRLSKERPMFGAIAEDVRPGRARVGWPWRLGWRMVVWIYRSLCDERATRDDAGGIGMCGSEACCRRCRTDDPGL